MKNLLLILFTITFLSSCINEPKSIGMTNWSDDGKEYKFHLGTEDAIDVVRKYDELLTAKDWEGALELFADTATVTYHNGVKVSPQTCLKWQELETQIMLQTTLTIHGLYKVLFQST